MATGWLLDSGWLPFFLSRDGFPNHLEECYFKPGTSKNAEFETLWAHCYNDEKQRRAAFFYRIKDTAENRSVLRAALSEFYRKKLMTEKELEIWLAINRLEIERFVPRLS